MRRRIRVSADSATSMDREEAVAVVVGVEVGPRSTWTTSLEQRRRPCIAGEKRELRTGFEFGFGKFRDVNGGKCGVRMGLGNGERDRERFIK